MRVLVASEARFGIAPDGAVYADCAEDYAFWSAYRVGFDRTEPDPARSEPDTSDQDKPSLDRFDQVGVLARLRPIDGPGNRGRACGLGVVFHALPDYRGPWQYLLCLRRLRRAVRCAVRASDACVLRAPGAVAFLAWREIRRQAKPWAVEVLGDPWQSLAGISALARRWSRRCLLRLCRQAPVICYVTRRWLQHRYPPGSAAVVFACPDVRLAGRPGEDLLDRRIAGLRQAGGRSREIGFVGSLERLYKAPEVHLRAIRLCLERGLPLRFSLLGDGRCRPALERLSEELGIADHVRFLGSVSPGAVHDFLDHIDLFVLASRTEGFPRALVEAMARACPAIGSTAGGIPELLAPEDLVEPGCAHALAAKIAEVIEDPARMAAMARRNFAVAGSFHLKWLAPIRRRFLSELLRLTRPKLVHVATVDRFWPLLHGQTAYMQARGFELHAVSSPGPLLDRFAREHHARARPIPMTRSITPWRDLVALWRLWRLFARLRPCIVHAHTPKAGLLAMLAARAARTPARLYTLHGLVWQTRRGASRRLLVVLERLACLLSSRILAVSRSVQQRAIEAGLVPPEKIRLAGNGSANGLDFERFDPARVDRAAVAGLRVAYGIPEGVPVVGFVGRLVPDKGVAELDAAWQQLRARFSSLHLLLVGETEAHNPLPPPLWERLRGDPRVHLCGWQDAMPDHYCLMDVCVLPSRREGLPYAALEAAAMTCPVAAFAVDGAVDAVEHGVTGLLAPPGDAAALAGHVTRMLSDPSLARRLGLQARLRAERLYQAGPLWAEIYQQYLEVSREQPRLWWKRPLDLAAALLLLGLLAPVLALVALAVFFDLGSPLFYRQRRPGLEGRPFEILKFRTMRAGPGLDRDRLTRLGRFLRRTSLDEIPQLVNVLRGEMSLVGPRPLLERYMAFYTSEESRRHRVRPGLTGWAQIHGRNDLDWQRRLELDVWYVDHTSFRLDGRILLRTLWKILTRDGAREDPVSSRLDLDVERQRA